MSGLIRFGGAGKLVRRVAVVALATSVVAAPTAFADTVEFYSEGETAPETRAGVRVIPCYLSGPNVFRATASILGSTASVRCIGSSRVTIRVSWYRSGVLVGSNDGGGVNFATTTAGTRCLRGASYQPFASVYATAPNAVPAFRTFAGPWGFYCGR